MSACYFFTFLSLSLHDMCIKILSKKLNMKSKFLNLLLLVLLGGGFVACGNPEVSEYHHGTFTSVFDVKEGHLLPAFCDDKYSVNNYLDMGLNNGDRAYLCMDYYFDPYAMSAPKMNISEFYARVPLRSMSKKNTFDKDLYQSSIASVHPVTLSTINAMWNVEVLKEDFLWADNETQNVVVRYDESNIGDFKMVLDSVSIGGIYDSTGRMAKVLCFRLYSNLSPANGTVDPYVFDSGVQGKVAKILSFKMDWSVIKAELERSNELQEITDSEMLSSRISFTSDINENGAVVRKVGHYFTYDYFKNPLYMK